MIKDGGPAFPLDSKLAPDGGINSYWTQHPQPGMTLRDWFAGQAIAGFMAQSHAGPKDWQSMGHGWGEDCANDLNAHNGSIATTLASFAYAVADAMIALRDVKEGEA